MKPTILAAAFFATAALTAPAYAGGSSSGSLARSGSLAQAIAIAPVVGGGGDTTQTIRNTPDVAALSYAGAGNACGVGGSLGVSMAGFGIGGGIATTSHECSMRNWFAIMAITWVHTKNPAYMQWANGIACEQSDLRSVAPPGVCAPTGQSAAAAREPVAAVAPAAPAPLTCRMVYVPPKDPLGAGDERRVCG